MLTLTLYLYAERVEDISYFDKLVIYIMFNEK